MLRTFAVYQLFVGVVAFTADAVQTAVLAENNIAVVVNALQNLVDDDFVALLGGADKLVVRDVERIPGALKLA